MPIPDVFGSKNSQVYKTVDTNYKDGFVQCDCGWKQSLGDGFNQYYIGSCPDCDPTISTRNQRKVTYGRPNNLTVEIGDNIYFVLSNGIHVRFKKHIYETHHGLSERQADML